jgi:hypothetical protein
MKDYSKIPNLFDFELDYDGDWNDISLPNGFDTDEVEKEIISLLDEWVKKDLIELGEKTTGTVWKEKNHFYIKGQVCVELGEDESDDEWEEFEVKIMF